MMDHTQMEHSAMNHSEMHMGSPSPSQSMNYGVTGMDHGGMAMSMQMWFVASEKLTLWFKEWDISNRAE